VLLDRGKIRSYEFTIDHETGEATVHLDFPLRVIGGPTKSALRSCSIDIELGREDGKKLLHELARGAPIYISVVFGD